MGKRYQSHGDFFGFHFTGESTPPCIVYALREYLDFA